ncbi:hypothetical protein CEXT_733371 [Caerostris extrusa]|uniref:Uncharacterized protein n=1 Tax=Caerostris extrusa TaxID=172846 RepID=A0AAV4TCZ5_CAEEX|nr:hypothetical protein CEXT_733371 [Caerostris extrusa]
MGPFFEEEILILFSALELSFTSSFFSILSRMDFGKESWQKSSSKCPHMGMDFPSIAAPSRWVHMLVRYLKSEA